MDLKDKFFKKGEILQRAGELKKRSYIIKKGLLRSYVIDSLGKEHTFMFAPEGWNLADPEVNINSLPSEWFVEALEDSIIEIVENPKASVKDMTIDEIGSAFAGTLKRMAVLQKRVLSLMSALGIERYIDFINTYPDIVKRVPQHMIASYLGITPEALSKVKRQYEKNETS